MGKLTFSVSEVPRGCPGGQGPGAQRPALDSENTGFGVLCLSGPRAAQPAIRRWVTPCKTSGGGQGWGGGSRPPLSPPPRLSFLSLGVSPSPSIPCTDYHGAFHCCAGRLRSLRNKGLPWKENESILGVAEMHLVSTCQPRVHGGRTRTDTGRHRRQRAAGGVRSALEAGLLHPSGCRVLLPSHLRPHISKKHTDKPEITSFIRRHTRPIPSWV